MGRTKRRRRRLKRTIPQRSPIDSAPNIISLKRWMKDHGWKDPLRLKLERFESTNRGLTSPKNISPGDILIEIPGELLVTCATVAKTDLSKALAKEKFKTQELLALFLAVERRKGEDSTWKCYLNSLPEDVPPVPWLCTEEEMKLLPSDFRSEVEKRRSVFKSSWERVGAFVSLAEFTWAYAMVNSRAVYVEPGLFKHHDPVTSDEPSMALCPYLDMFNHSCSAATSASLIYESHSWKYVLITSDRYNKYEQVFISYGAHDNVTLMCEYGFFIPGNPLDTVPFTLEQILAARDSPLSKRQFNFVGNDRWATNLHVSVNQGLSFNLKAVLYVVLNEDRRSDWNQVIFSGNYASADLRLMYTFAGELLGSKLEACAREVGRIGDVQGKSVYLQNVLSYLKYRIDFINELLRVNAEEINRLANCFFVLLVHSQKPSRFWFNFPA